MVTFPPCKINLGLHILSRRADGYHAIETVFYPVPWTDVLEIIPSEKLSFQSSGAAIPGREEDNLCLKAYQLLKKEHSIPPVSIHLHKTIPMGAGLGGGSSDAAYTLRMLNEKLELKLTTEQLQNYAAQLGSDCSFFIQDAPMLGKGRGEELSAIQLNLRGKYVVLINPAIHVSTADAYRGVSPRIPAVSLMECIQLPMEKWKEVVINDFEETVFRQHPAIAQWKQRFYELGAVYACMSGSGSSVFGVFNEEIKEDPSWQQLDHWSGWLP